MNISGYKSVLQPLRFYTQPLYVWIHFLDAIKILLFTVYLQRESQSWTDWTINELVD